MSEKILAKHWEKATGDAVKCTLCPHNCQIAEGQTGICGGRENSGGQLYAAHYGMVSSVALDPVEKKPLRRFHPGMMILSVGGYGCNLHCPFCQNSHISLKYDCSEGDVLTPDDVLAYARKTRGGGNLGVAYTYNEPLIGYEFVYDCAKLVRKVGMMNVLVTNGFINPKPLAELIPHIDAMNIDLKGFTAGFYQNVGGELEAVKETIAYAYKRCHVEVTTLVIPGENEDDIEGIAQWLAGIDPNISLHLTRFFPRHLYLEKEPTPLETVQRLGEIASKHLHHVFV